MDSFVQIKQLNDYDLEEFWLDELEKASGLSPRLEILLLFRQTFPKWWFVSLIKDARFLDVIDDLARQLQKTEFGGRPPDVNTFIAYMRLRAGIPYEEVLEDTLQEEVLRSRRGNTDCETVVARQRCEEPIKKKVYRVCKSLEAEGFQIKHISHTSKASVEFYKALREGSAKYKWPDM